MPFVDLDEEIERRAGMRGAGDLRARRASRPSAAWSRRLCEATSILPDVVVATGGGTVGVRGQRPADRGERPLGLAEPAVRRRSSARIGGLGKEDRPLFRDEMQALALYRERLPAYRRADLTVDMAPDEGPEEIAARIALLSETDGEGRLRYLILSDMHANWDAFEAVLRRARRKRFDAVLVLGDLVGYGGGSQPGGGGGARASARGSTRCGATTTRWWPGSTPAATSTRPRWRRRSGRPAA